MIIEIENEFAGIVVRNHPIDVTDSASLFDKLEKTMFLATYSRLPIDHTTSVRVNNCRTRASMEFACLPASEEDRVSVKGEFDRPVFVYYIIGEVSFTLPSERKPSLLERVKGLLK